MGVRTSGSARRVGRDRVCDSHLRREDQMNAPRKKLGRSTQAFAREAVYEMADGLETESSEHYEVIRKRVLFEDVLLVTYHREIGIWFMILNGLIGGLFLFLGAVIMNYQRTGNMWLIALPW